MTDFDNEGWVKLHRKILKWEWIDDLPTLRVFLQLLFEANYEDRRWKGVEVKRGQCITGYLSLSKKTKLTVQQCRTAIKHLKSTGEITVQPTNRYSLITITKYSTYQTSEPIANQQTNRLANSQATGKQQASNKQSTTPKEVKNLRTKELKKVNGHKPVFDPKNKTKYLDWVYLSTEQYQSVKEYYQQRGLGKEVFEEAIRNLDAWFANNPKMRPKRTDDARALKGWPLDEALKRQANIERLEKLRG